MNRLRQPKLPHPETEPRKRDERAQCERGRIGELDELAGEVEHLEGRLAGG